MESPEALFSAPTDPVKDIGDVMKRSIGKSTGSAALGTPIMADPQIPTGKASSRSGAGPDNIGHSVESAGSAAPGTAVKASSLPQNPIGKINSGSGKIGHSAKSTVAVALVVPDPLPPIPTGNVNSGPGAGAYNIGDSAAGVKASGREAEVSFSSNDRKAEVPKGGNNNIGPGAGAVNEGLGAAAIEVKDGAKIKF